ncbi:MAG: ArsR/SmtB family transcription factor [Propioniciclava sp.]
MTDLVHSGGRHPAHPYVELAVEVFSMLAEATRVRLILALADGELSVNRLAEIVEKPASTVSQHLAKMRLARMVATRQEGTRVYYRLVDEHALALVDEALKQAEHAVHSGGDRAR